jgi:hypothetical protein
MLIVMSGGDRPSAGAMSIPLVLQVPPEAVSPIQPLRIHCPMGQLSLGQLIVILLSFAMWIGATWAVVIAARKMGLFGRKDK